MKEEIMKIIEKHTPSTTYIDGANAADEILDLINGGGKGLNGTDVVDEYGQRHLVDCMLIKDALILNGHPNAGLSDAVRLWGQYSESYAAGWMGLPDTDDEIFECIKPYLPKP